MTQTEWLYKTILEVLPLEGREEGMTTSQLTRAINHRCRHERDGIYQEPSWPGYSVQSIDARCRDREIRDKVVADGGFRWRSQNQQVEFEESGQGVLSLTKGGG